MDTASSPSPLKFTSEHAIAALKSILTAFESPENVKKINEAKATAGNDMLKAMQTVFPITTQVQMSVIPSYGFTADGEGLIRFTQAIKVHERHNEELQRLNHALRTHVMPQVEPPAPPGPALTESSKSLSASVSQGSS